MRCSCARRTVESPAFSKCSYWRRSFSPLRVGVEAKSRRFVQPPRVGVDANCVGCAPPKRLKQRPFRAEVLYTAGRNGSKFLRSVEATDSAKLWVHFYPRAKTPPQLGSLAVSPRFVRRSFSPPRLRAKQVGLVNHFRHRRRRRDQTHRNCVIRSTTGVPLDSNPILHSERASSARNASADSGAGDFLLST